MPLKKKKVFLPAKPVVSIRKSGGLVLSSLAKKRVPRYFFDVVNLSARGISVNNSTAVKIANRYSGVEPKDVLLAASRLNKLLPKLFPPEKKSFVVREKRFRPHYEEILALALDGVFVDKILAEKIASRHPGVKPHSVLVASNRLRYLFPDVFPSPKEFGRKKRLPSSDQAYLARGKHISQTPFFAELKAGAKKGIYLDKVWRHEMADKYGVALSTIDRANAVLKNKEPELFPDLKSIGRRMGAIIYHYKELQGNVSLLRRKKIQKIPYSSLSKKWGISVTTIRKEVKRIQGKFNH